MTINDYTLRSTIDRNKQFYLEHYGKLDAQWTDEGLIWSIIDYYACKGSVEDFTEDDWKVIKECGLNKEHVIQLFNDDNTVQN